jgi:cystathionine beta-lyase/cystathionine gamma-synthase
MSTTHAPKPPHTGSNAAAALSRQFDLAREISPRRHSTEATDAAGLVAEQMAHFGLDPASPYAQRLASLARHLYEGHADLKQLYQSAVSELASLPRADRVQRFAAQKFIAYQMAKMLDTLQQTSRSVYQSVVDDPSQRSRKGPYPVFDNVTAIFSAQPVITRTATYIYACAEWVEDAFQGKELMLEIYSRLLNPTNVSLANHIVDVEAGALAHEYFAWNFNSGMAAIDGILSHLVGYEDVVLSSRNVYGGTYQLLVDWFGKKSNLSVGVEFFDGYDQSAFLKALDAVQTKYKERLDRGRHVYVYLESPCNPHGYVLDVPAICKAAHERKLTVICDSTVGTPFLHRPLRRKDSLERPDFVVHSYTKDIGGHGSVTAGCVIGRNERMFMGKHDVVAGVDVDGSPRNWGGEETLFWNVYYIKGAFLDSEKAFEVLNGMHTLELRMLQKCINTLTLVECLARHPDVNVRCCAAPGNENAAQREKCLYLGLPAPLFTFDFEGKPGAQAAAKASANGAAGHPGGGAAGSMFSRTVFKRFFDMLDPVFGHQVSLGQANTVVLCPAITSHSEMSAQALADAGISLTTTRVAVGTEDPRTLVVHLINAARATLEQERPGFVDRFPAPAEIDAIYRKHYLDVHRRYVESLPGTAEMME